MPKKYNRRIDRARELLATLERGPSLSDGGQLRYTPADATHSTHLWLQTWVIPAVKELVPELRQKA